MEGVRKAKINGEILMGEDCNFENLVDDIFACLQKHNATANLMAYELPQKDEIEHNTEIKNAIQSAIEKRKQK